MGKGRGRPATVRDTLQTNCSPNVRRQGNVTCRTHILFLEEVGSFYEGWVMIKQNGFRITEPTEAALKEAIRTLDQLPARARACPLGIAPARLEDRM